MKLKLHKAGKPGAETILVEFCLMLDRAIPLARTVCLAAGVAAAALDTGVSADLLFAAGMAMQFAIWFENWWLPARAR